MNYNRLISARLFPYYKVIKVDEQNEGLASRFVGISGTHLPARKTSPLIGRNSTKQRWVPPSIQLRDVKLDKNEVTFRQTRSILNKLTPEKFDKLCQEILNIGIDSKVVLKGIVILIFEKAIDELRYSSLYANLCRRLYHEAPNFDIQPVGSSLPKPNTFRRLLIAKLQDEFENRNKKLDAFDSKDGALTTEEEEQRGRAKQHMLGNIKFIGELYRLSLLHENILHKCIKQLINKKKKGTIDDLSEDLECLCQIMTTCGRRLDHEKAKSLMDQYFDRLEYLQKKKMELPSRVRFLLQDVIDLRAANWVPRSVQVNQGPKTLGQIRTELSESYPSLMLPMKGQTGVTQHARSHGGHDSLQYSGLGFFPMTKKQQYHGLNASLSPPLPVQNNGEPTSPGMGFDFFSSPPKGHPQQGHPIRAPRPTNGGFPNNQQIHPSFTPQYMNGGGGPPLRYMAQIPLQHPVYNGYPRPMQRYPGHSLPGTYIGGVNQQGVRQSTTTNGGSAIRTKQEVVPRFQRKNASPDFEEAKSVDAASNILLTKQPACNMPAQQKVVNHNSAVNSTSSPRRNVDNRGLPLGKAAPPPQATADTFQPSFQHIIDNAKYKPPNRKVSGSTSQDRLKMKKPSMSDKDAQKILDKIIHDFYDKESRGIDEIVASISDAKLPKKYIANLSNLLFDKSLHSTDDNRDIVCQVLKSLFDEKLLSQDVIVDGLQSVFDKLSGLEGELPRIKSITASLVARVVCNDLLTLNDVAERLEGGYHFPLFLLTLQQIVKINGKDWLSRFFEDSKVNMMVMMPEVSQSKTTMFEILKGKQLSFLFPLLHMETQLNVQLAQNSSPNIVYRWIKDNVSTNLHSNPGFINTLVTCCLSHVTKQSSLAHGIDRTRTVSKDVQDEEKNLLLKIKPVLQKFLHDKPDLQLHALYAVQVFCYNANFPKGLMLRMFNLMYDVDIIDEETFITWKEDVNNEFPGKGKSLFQVNSWLTWLQEADTEEDEDDEVDT